jgi:hypothetical protein
LVFRGRKKGSEQQVVRKDKKRKEQKNKLWSGVCEEEFVQAFGGTGVIDLID